MPLITITAKRDGFRRCGVAHRDVPVVWPDGSFTDEQIAILRVEPSLVVHLGPVSGDVDKLKAALGRVQELESQLEDVTTDRDRLQAALALKTVSLSPGEKDNAVDDTAAAESSAKASLSPTAKETAADDTAAVDSSAKAKK